MRRDIELEATIVEKYAAVETFLDERGRRIWAATESRAIGYGGDALVSDATGLSRPTIRAGRRELESGRVERGRVRRPGAGRPGIEQSQPGIKEALEKRVDPLTRGDPESPLRWTCKSRAKLTAALSKAGWKVSSTTVSRLLHELGYSLQSVRKSREGVSHPDRNAQFEHINAKADEFLPAQPEVSVDTKKKELVGDFSNGGREWQPVLSNHWSMTFRDGRIPYGIYDMPKRGSTSPMTTIRLRLPWPRCGGGGGMVQEALPRTLGSSLPSVREQRVSRAWKHRLQHFAPRASTSPSPRAPANKIEHRPATSHRRGKPHGPSRPLSILIGNTRTDTGLRVKAKLVKESTPPVSESRRRRWTLCHASKRIGTKQDDEVGKLILIRVLWVPGVNRLGTYGRWAFAEFRDVYTMREGLELRSSLHNEFEHAASEFLKKARRAEAAQSLIRAGGTMPDLECIPRRKSVIWE